MRLKQVKNCVSTYKCAYNLTGNYFTVLFFFTPTFESYTLYSDNALHTLIRVKTYQ